MTASEDGLPVGLTIGLLLSVTLGALESLTVLSVMPLVAADLDGLALYGWVFGGFFVSSAVAIPIAAQVVDRFSLRVPFIVGLALFGGGLLIAGFAPSMLVLVGGRFLQGAGAGTISAATYATVAIAYTPRQRGRVLALFSTAWLVPALVGPLLGSVIAEVAGWRWTFLALAAFVPVALLLALPAVSLHDRGRTRAAVAAGSLRRSFLPPREVGRAAVLSLLGASAIYGLITFAPLGMTEIRGQSTLEAGLGVAVCSVAWIAASWLQERTIERFALHDAIRFGLLFLTIVSVPLAAVVAPSLPFTLILVAYALVGLGAGVAFQAITLLVMSLAVTGREGQATSSVQLANTVGAAVGTTALGALFNLAQSSGLDAGGALLAVFAVCWVVLAVSTILAWGRSRSDASRDRQAVTAVG